ncbi:hypothetical protein GCM10022377_10320 [Zhihengliuella alba]|uniref:Chemotaxis protein n=1 Tax=Zhihengliuella alba TaxID=547018 RepID=A0ABP7D3Y9_9MICC
MLEQLPLAAIGAIGTPGLLALAVYLVLTGRIVPRSTLEDVKAGLVEQLTFWRTTAQKKDHTIELLSEANRILADETGASVTKVMGAIQDKAGVHDG